MILRDWEKVKMLDEKTSSKKGSAPFLLFIVLIIFLFSLSERSFSQTSDINSLITDLSSEDGAIVSRALGDLSSLGPDAALAIPAISKLLNDNKHYDSCNSFECVGIDNLVYGNAFHTLKSIGPLSVDAFTAVMPYLKKADVGDAHLIELEFRDAVLDLLAIWGEKASAAVPDLIEILNETNARSDKDIPRAIEILGKMRKKAEPAVPLIVRYAYASKLYGTSNTILVFIALNEIATPDRRILKLYTDMIWDQPGFLNLQELGVIYLQRYSKFEKEDLNILDKWLKKSRERDKDWRDNDPFYSSVIKILSEKGTTPFSEKKKGVVPF